MESATLASSKFRLAIGSILLITILLVFDKLGEEVFGEIFIASLFAYCSAEAFQKGFKK